MKFFSGKHKTRAIITRTAATILLSMLFLAYTGSGDSAETDSNGHVQWVYKDSYDPANRGSVVVALAKAGITVSDVHGAGWNTIDQAISTANSECVTRGQDHGDEQFSAVW